MFDKFHILILSAGSLLGQNILDSLEGRRHKVRVIGADCSSNNPRIFRCDKVYKTALVESPDFLSSILNIIEIEQPDLILPGRDHDVLALAELASMSSDLKKRIATGTFEAVEIMNDKGKSYDFSRKYNLPFAKSFVINEGCINEAHTWAKTCSFPLLAKPRKGFGSLGIRIICNEEQLSSFLMSNQNGYMLQEILDFTEERYRLIENLQVEMKTGIPFFFHIPDEFQFAGQTVINPDGSIGEIFTSKNLMVIGRCERSERWDDPILQALTRAYAEAISDVGWRGVFNFQCRRVNNEYIGHEMNGRMSGSTSARLWLGYDEIRKLIQSFYGYDIGLDSRIPDTISGTVYRSLTDYFVLDKDKEVFENIGKWEKK